MLFPYDVMQGSILYLLASPVNHDNNHSFYLRLGVLGSAVCRYSMKSVTKLFDASQYLKETTDKGFDGTSLWVSVSPINLTMVPGRPKVREMDSAT